MTREELISYCRFYKGEENDKDCPYDRGESRATFWGLEKMYVDSAVKNGNKVTFWENIASSYIERHPEEKSEITSNNISLHSKGLYFYVLEMFSKWCPYEVGNIQQYWK